MDIDFSKKVGMAIFLQKLLNIRQPEWPKGIVYYDIKGMYVFLGDGIWHRLDS